MDKGRERETMRRILGNIKKERGGGGGGGDLQIDVVKQSQRKTKTD